MNGEKPPKKWLFETHVASGRGYEEAEHTPAIIRWGGTRLRLFPRDNLQILDTALIHNI